MFSLSLSSRLSIVVPVTLSACHSFTQSAIAAVWRYNDVCLVGLYFDINTTKLYGQKTGWWIEGGQQPPQR